MSHVKKKIKDSDFMNKLDRKQKNKAIRQFARKLIEQSRDIDPEINAIVRKHFWEML